MALGLDITYANGETASFPLDQDEIVLGRDAGVGITLPDAKVSRRHARIARRDGGFWLEDLGSANGVVLDGLPLTGHALVTAGSLVQVGDCQIRVVDQEGLQAPLPRDTSRYVSPVGAQDRTNVTRFALRVVEGELLGQSFVLDLDETVVGRGADAQLNLEATSISRRHAVIRKADADSVTVEDLGSSNGTYVGELALDGSQVVRVGEQVRFGTLVLELTRAEENAAPPPFDPSAGADAPLPAPTRPLPPDEVRETATPPRDTLQDEPLAQTPLAAEEGPDRRAPADGSESAHEPATEAIESTRAEPMPASAPAAEPAPGTAEAREPAAPRPTPVPRETRAAEEASPAPPWQQPLAQATSASSAPVLPASATASSRPTDEPAEAPPDAAAAPDRGAAGPRAEAAPRAPRAAALRAGLLAAGRRLARPLQSRRGRRLAVAAALVLAMGAGLRALRTAQQRGTLPPMADIGHEAVDLALGYGPQRDERAWRARREAELKKAEVALHDGEWEAAQAAIAQALKLDATHPGALLLRARIERAARAEASASLALSLRTASRWSQALMAASDALADFEGDARPTAVSRRGELLRIVQGSRQHLASYCSEEARVACGQERYENCVSQAACALGYDADDQQSLACLNLAASVVDPENAARPPQGRGKDDGVDVGAAPAVDARAAAAKYGAERIRLAVLSYAAGSLPLASLRLRNIDDPPSRAVLADLDALQAAIAGAKQQEQAGAFAGALSSYENALAIDARLVPKDLPSGPRDQLTAGAQAMYLTLGDAAFAKAAFGEALLTWQRGLTLDRSYLPLLQALDKLDTRAQALLDQAALARRGKADGDPCQLLRQAAAMTPEASALHKTAEAALVGCKAGHPAKHD